MKREEKIRLMMQAETAERLERWKDPARLRAFAEGLAELRREIERQEQQLSALRAREADFPQS